MGPRDPPFLPWEERSRPAGDLIWVVWPITPPTTSLLLHPFSLPLLHHPFLQTSSGHGCFVGSRFGRLLPFRAFLIYHALGVDLDKGPPFGEPQYPESCAWHLMPWTI
uniref:Uncharacterized protein n=1 Tax=Fagus sylvatica TaxID=28930 RepID=A0A2N9HFQ2_FAGSY